MTLGGRTGTIFTALLAAAALLVLSSPGVWGQPANEAVDEDPGGFDYVAGELLVTYKPGVAAEAARASSQQAGARIEEEITAIRARLLSFPEIKNQRAQENREQALERVKQALEQNPNVEAVDYNYIYELTYSPNDPKFDRQQYGLKKPRFHRAWDRVWGTSRTKIAVVDTGVYARHPDLRGKIVAQRDFINRDRVADDDHGHGTHVSGIAAAVTDNGKGIAGGCPGCDLAVAKVVDSRGDGPLSAVVRGITWSADKGAKVINLSLGDKKSTTSLSNAVDYAAGKGAVLVAAAGNSNSNERIYPAAYPKVLAVAATDRRDRRASFSQYGNWVAVSAPGVDIVSTTRDGKYGLKTGTSMASPEVAALAGLLADQGRSRGQIRSRILKTAVDLGSAGKDPYYGYGRIHAYRAVRR